MMGNSKVARVIVVGESEGIGGIYKYVWRKEQVTNNNIHSYGSRDVRNSTIIPVLE